MSKFHRFEREIGGLEVPRLFTWPFHYVPAKLSVLAAEQVKRHVATRADWTAELQAGKMLGVLVVRDAAGELGFLAAYSGNLCGRNDHDYFVPPVYDLLQPDGEFRQGEAAITVINHEIEQLEHSDELAQLLHNQSCVLGNRDQAIAAFKQLMAQSKAERDLRRAQGGLTADEQQALLAESQFQKAELRRLKKRWDDIVRDAEREKTSMESEILALKQERKQRSDALQRWLFDHFEMLNGQGERRTLTEIFIHTPQGLPPAGSGECCAPKLLQYAYEHHLQPLAIAEFWQGRSPRMEIRHHGQYYPACRGKCKPILEWMLGDVVTKAGAPCRDADYGVVYQDESIVVIDKPAGLLSVPGKTEEPSVESLLSKHFPQIYMVHRLDMDTSGLMVVALTQDAYHRLQRQFLTRTIYKKYIALLDGEVLGEGSISLPLRPDHLDRPRQVVDTEHGKAAVTDYRVLEHRDGQTLVELTPHTGRTHQLRVHCAHQSGLNCPIVGDRLYGKPARRLCLHAAELAFDHPATGQRLTFSSPVMF